jgi:hypothetical protein
MVTRSTSVVAKREDKLSSISGVSMADACVFDMYTMLHWRLATKTMKRALDWRYLLAVTLQPSSYGQSLQIFVGNKPPSQPTLVSLFVASFRILHVHHRLLNLTIISYMCRREPCYLISQSSDTYYRSFTITLRCRRMLQISESDIRTSDDCSGTSFRRFQLGSLALTKRPLCSHSTAYTGKIHFYPT